MADLVLYDATCGICTSFRDFARERAPDGALDFQPLGSAAHRARVSAELQAEAPDTVIVVTDAGEELTRGAAVRRVLSGLGAPWSWLARTLALLPDGRRAVQDEHHRQLIHGAAEGELGQGAHHGSGGGGGFGQAACLFVILEG